MRTNCSRFGSHGSREMLICSTKILASDFDPKIPLSFLECRSWPFIGPGQHRFRGGAQSISWELLFEEARELPGLFSAEDQAMSVMPVTSWRVMV